MQPTDGLAGFRLAPFAALASEGANLVDRDHGWHLALADRLVQADPLYQRHQLVFAILACESEPVDPRL